MANSRLAASLAATSIAGGICAWLLLAYNAEPAPTHMDARQSSLEAALRSLSEQLALLQTQSAATAKAVDRLESRLSVLETRSNEPETSEAQLAPEPAVVSAEEALEKFLHDTVESAKFSDLSEDERTGLRFGGTPFVDRFDNAVYLIDDDTVSIYVLTDWLDSALPEAGRAALESYAVAQYATSAIDPCRAEFLQQLGDFSSYDTEVEASRYLSEQKGEKLVPLRGGGFAVVSQDVYSALARVAAEAHRRMAASVSSLQQFGPLVSSKRPKNQ